MKPLYKWPGGKAREIEIIEKNLPKNFERYIEPFFGGGALFFYLENNSNVINELNKEVCNFLELIKQGMAKEIYDKLVNISNDEKTYYTIRAWEPKTTLDKAIRFYYLRKTCFRGLSRYNSSGVFNVPYGNYKTYVLDELLEKKYNELLKNTVIMNEDFNEVFNHYDDENDFCFLDPPYHNTFSNYTSDGFNDDKHIKLAERFKKTKMKCLMIIGKTDLIEELYQGYITEEYAKKYSITRSTKQEKNSGIKRVVKGSIHLIVKNY